MFGFAVACIDCTLGLSRACRFVLMKECWDKVVESRPTFTQLKHKLKVQAITFRKARNSMAAEAEEQIQYM